MCSRSFGGTGAILVGSGSGGGRLVASAVFESENTRRNCIASCEGVAE